MVFVGIDLHLVVGIAAPRVSSVSALSPVSSCMARLRKVMRWLRSDGMVVMVVLQVELEAYAALLLLRC